MDVVDFETKKILLKKQTCFSKLTSEEIEKLAELLVETHYKAGDTIVTEGDPVDSVYLIVSGTVDVRHILLKDNIPQINSVATLGPTAAIGLDEYGFYSLTGMRTATVVALTDLVLLRLSVVEFHGFKLAYSHVSEVMRGNPEQIPDEK